ncbi:permease [Corynebacterium sp.]|uniref:permease n=1 Tax=Corynebacterium sp. TaxID=1720 RepID=UPI0026DBCB7D|nr:permease [Corynebacterium sp.]MDO5031410.1 permease [Corynebacterium sp.]
MRLWADTSTWMPNYRFAYVLVWVGLVLSVVGALGLALSGGEALSIGIAIVVAVYCAGMVVVMPRWALDAEGEKKRRRQAREARRELRQRRRGR